jgi:hypothetical protein
MDPKEAMKRIKTAIDGSPRNDYVKALHLQIIKYADVLQNITGKEFCEGVDISPAYGIEFAKMRKIAEPLRRAGLDPNKL